MFMGSPGTDLVLVDVYDWWGVLSAL